MMLFYFLLSFLPICQFCTKKKKQKVSHNFYSACPVKLFNHSIKNTSHFPLISIILTLDLIKEYFWSQLINGATMNFNIVYLFLRIFTPDLFRLI